MDDSARLPMADILPLLSAPATSSGTWLTVLLIGLLLLVAVLLWRYYRSPLVVLSRQLYAGERSPRDVAHQLAMQVDKTLPLSQQLDHLRFQANPPDIGAVAALIRKIHHGS